MAGRKITNRDTAEAVKAALLGQKVRLRITPGQRQFIKHNIEQHRCRRCGCEV